MPTSIVSILKLSCWISLGLETLNFNRTQNNEFIYLGNFSSPNIVWSVYVFLVYVLVISGKLSNFLRDNQINLLSCEITRIKIRSTMSLINTFRRRTQMYWSLNVNLTTGMRSCDQKETGPKRKFCHFRIEPYTSQGRRKLIQSGWARQKLFYWL